MKLQEGNKFCGIDTGRLRLLVVLTLLAGSPIWTTWADDLQYTYDSLHRLVQVRYSDKIIIYTYDAAGNRSSLVIDNPNPVPALSNLNPNSAVAGGAGFNLIVTGTNFLNSSTVQWNGTPRTTSFGSSTQLSASIDAADIATIGTASVTVVNPAPGGGASNALTFNITPPCNYSAFPSSQSFTASGGADIVSVVVPNGCAWTATSNATWITINSGSSGSGNGAVNYSVAANTGIGRSGTMTVAGQTVTITQGPGCSLSLNSNGQSFSASGGTSSVNVTAGTGCDWQAQSNAGFITITSGAGGVSNGTVNYSVETNTTTSQRTGTMTIAGQSFTVTQAGANCTFSLSSTSQSFGATGGTGSVDVTTVAACAWTAASNDGWVTITSGSSGSGNGTVNYSVAANTGGARIGTMTIAGQTFTVNQSSGCTFSLDHSSKDFTSAGGTDSVSVTASDSTCHWTATSNDGFITITSGSSGNGNGAVNYSVAANGANPRTGTMTIAGKTFTVNQSGVSCSFSLGGSSNAFSPVGGTGGFSVTTTSTCNWTSTSNDSWLVITSGGSSAGSGNVNYSVDSNLSVNTRTGSITAAGQTFTVNQSGIAAVGLSSFKNDFDSDGRAELGFYRNGLWGFLKSSSSFSTGTSQFFSWGGSGLQPIIADFDGDSKADLAYMVPPGGGQSAAYAILRSTTGYGFGPGQPLFVAAGFPSLGDTPVVGDVDADGKADPGIWRASQGVWIIPNSSSNYTTFVFSQWGQLGDIPVVADIDGDGKADLGFYRDGLWGFLKSSQSYSTGAAQFFSWGGAGLQPIVGDFDGDGKADIGYMVPPSGGQSASYAILKSSTGYSFAPGQPLFVSAGFPSLGDTPVIGDFDGDGKADPGIWRESQGVWIIPLSAANYASYVFSQWGQSGDIPVPNTTGKH